MQSLRLRRGTPYEPEAFPFDPHQGQDLFDRHRPCFCLLIAILVITLPWVAAHHQNAIRTPLKGFDNQVRMNHHRAHDANDSQTGGVLDACGARKVSRRIGAPVASKGQDLGFESWIYVRQVQILQTPGSSFKRSPDLRGKLAVRKARYADSFLGACSLAGAATFAFGRRQQVSVSRFHPYLPSLPFQ